LALPKALSKSRAIANYLKIRDWRICLLRSVAQVLGSEHVKNLVVTVARCPDLSAALTGLETFLL
jgi:hypothetical protein